VAALSEWVTLRNAVAADDAGAPATAQGAVDCTGSKSVLVDVKVGGTSPAWDVTPLFWNALAGAYVAGNTVSVTVNRRFSFEVDGVTDFYVQVGNSSGDSPTISVYVGPSLL
jgi:hypothetical protein